MIVLRLIPDEVEIPLGERSKDFEGAVAVVRSLDIEEHAKITDGFGKGGVQTAALAIIRDRLVRIDGLGLQDRYGKIEPFDRKNALHWAQLPFEIIDHIFARLYAARDEDRVVKPTEPPPEASANA